MDSLTPTKLDCDLSRSTAHNVESKPHIGGLDFVRFFAASIVLFYHFAFASWDSPYGINFGIGSAPQYPELWIFKAGWVGVEVFFVLSGFVIANSANGRSAYDFALGRAKRLFPAVWIIGTLSFLIVLHFHVFEFWEALANYLRTIVLHRNGPWITGVYWTLAVETFFYALVFLLLWINQFKNIEKVAFALTIFSAAYLLAVAFLDFPKMRAIFLGQHGVFFSLGIAIWLIWMRGLSLGRLLIATIASASGIIEIASIGHGGQRADMEAVLAVLTWVLAVIAICVSLIYPDRGNRFTRTLGLMTYPLYLIHNVMGVVILRVTPWTGKYLAFGIAFLACVLASWLVVRCERPIGNAMSLLINWIAARLPFYLIAKTLRPSIPVPNTA